MPSSAIVTGGVVTTGQRVAFLVGEGEGGPQAEHVIPLVAGVGQPPAEDGADGTVTWYDEVKGFGSSVLMAVVRTSLYRPGHWSRG